MSFQSGYDDGLFERIHQGHQAYSGTGILQESFILIKYDFQLVISGINLYYLAMFLRIDATIINSTLEDALTIKNLGLIYACHHHRR